jgi:hypothetical protein
MILPSQNRFSGEASIGPDWTPKQDLHLCHICRRTWHGIATQVIHHPAHIHRHAAGPAWASWLSKALVVGSAFVTGFMNRSDQILMKLGPVKAVSPPAEMISVGCGSANWSRRPKQGATIWALPRASVCRKNSPLDGFFDLLQPITRGFIVSTLPFVKPVNS